MLVRSAARLWTPKYFRGQGTAPRHLGPRRTRLITETTGRASKAASLHTRPSPSQATSQPPQQEASHHSTTQQKPKQLRAASSATRATPPLLSPLAVRAQDLLRQLSCPPPSAHPTAAEAARGYAEFSARQEVLGPLRQLLPSAPPHLSASSSRTPGASSSREDPEVTTASFTAAAHPRLRIVLSDDMRVAAKPVDAPAHRFRLAELTLFLQLYEHVAAEDGQLLVQLMGEIRQQLLAYAASEDGAATATAPHAADAGVSACGATALPQTASDPHSRSAGSSPGVTLPLPALLYTMSSLGLVEEAVLRLITSVSSSSSNSSTGTTTARRGPLYRQLPLYTTEELLQLMVALHRFGHQQQPSMKAITKAIRASQYNSTSPAGVFHRRMREIKKRLYRSSRVRQTALADTGEGGGQSVEDDGISRDLGAAHAILKHSELQALVLQLRCPLFLLLEALTASALTLYRRTDVVSFLSDLTAVTAVLEIATALQTSAHATQATQQTGREDAQEYVLAVSHQLLRAAKLAEEMELPQPLLSDVFAWSCTVSSKGVIVDGGEDGDVPSDRKVFYDHVTADLIKASRAD